MNFLHLLQILAPEAILLATALLVMGLGLCAAPEKRRTWLALLTLLGGFLAGFALGLLVRPWLA